VELIRKKRRGAINAKQLEFLAKYRRKKYFIKVTYIKIHVAYPDPSYDPYVFGSPRSAEIRYESDLSSSKNSKEIIDFHCFVTYV
jgi:hypothetical protein